MSEDRVSLHPIRFEDAVRGLLSTPSADPPYLCVKPGDEIEVRSVDGGWYRTVARSGPRYDYEHAFRKKDCWLSIAVDHPGFEHPVNWPASYVRPLATAP